MLLHSEEIMNFFNIGKRKSRKERILNEIQNSGSIPHLRYRWSFGVSKQKSMHIITASLKICEKSYYCEEMIADSLHDMGLCLSVSHIAAEISRIESKILLENLGLSLET